MEIIVVIKHSSNMYSLLLTVREVKPCPHISRNGTFVSTLRLNSSKTK